MPGRIRHRADPVRVPLLSQAEATEEALAQDHPQYSICSMHKHVQMDELTHDHHWEVMGFADPVKSEEDRRLFRLCGNTCGSKEHRQVREPVVEAHAAHPSQLPAMQGGLLTLASAALHGCML